MGLVDDRTVPDDGFTKESTLNLSAQRGLMQIYIRIPARGIIVIEGLAPSDTIEYIKTKITDKEGIQTCQQTLIFSGIKLEDSTKLADYNIKNGSIIYLALKLLGGMELAIKLLNGKTIILYIEGNYTIGRFKEMIQTKEGIPFELQKIIFAGRELQNDRTLGDYNFQKSSTLHLIILVRGGF